MIANEPSVYRLDDEHLPAAQPLPLLIWDARHRRLDQSMFDAGRSTWFDRSAAPARWMGDWPVDFEGYRAVNGLALARLFRPKSAGSFEVEACGAPGSVLHSSIERTQLPQIAFAAPGCVVRSFPIPPASSRLVAVVFNVEAGDRVVRVGSFGFK